MSEVTSGDLRELTAATSDLNTTVAVLAVKVDEGTKETSRLRRVIDGDGDFPGLKTRVKVVETKVAGMKTLVVVAVGVPAALLGFIEFIQWMQG